MASRLGQWARKGLIVFVAAVAVAAGGGAVAAPYAAMVMDARNGEVLHAENADTRLHPASLTKMMTLYIVFEAVRNGEISLDTEVRISQFAAAEPPSKLGLQAGQRIRLRHLIRAAAVRSANDAATALGEAIEGSEAAFARRMNRTAQALGMTRTTFKNAHGLTEEGHLSTARDMTIMGRHLLFDFPEYYNLFSRITADAGVREVSNTNRRLLSDYKGADGIKTGYTRAAGFNLVASAERGSERVIATVFGGRSTVTRNARVAELLDLGFRQAPSRVAIRPPDPPNYGAPMRVGRTVSVVRAVATSPRPLPRPSPALPEALIADIQDNVAEAVEAAVTASIVEEAIENATAPPVTPIPEPRPESVTLAALAAPEEPAPALGEAEVVTRFSTSGDRHWGITIGSFPSRFKAEQMLLKTALAEIGMLDEALRKVVPSQGRFNASFVGMTKEHAALACRRLEARRMECETMGPG